MLKLFKKVLVLAPHTDDGEIGCGGTISKLLEKKSEVFYVAFSSAKESLKQKGLNENTLIQEVKVATQSLGIKKKNLIIFDHKLRFFTSLRQEILEDMINLKNKLKPDLVLMPSLSDIHQDHITIAQEGLRAFKNSTILAYELIWNNLNFHNTMFVKLEKKYIKAKWDALKKYNSQKNRSYMNEEFIYSLARSRGVQIGTKYAESFEVIRWVI
jgi:N-acetylglucosamine malate deacetylase 1